MLKSTGAHTPRVDISKEACLVTFWPLIYYLITESHFAQHISIMLHCLIYYIFPLHSDRNKDIQEPIEI